MNTLKKIVLFVLTLSLLACVAFSFASCNTPGGSSNGDNNNGDNNNDGGNDNNDNDGGNNNDNTDGGNNNTGSGNIPDNYHCPDDCDCREDEGGDEGSVPDNYHCPNDCECRADDVDQNTTPSKNTYIVIVRDDQGLPVYGKEDEPPVVTDGALLTGVTLVVSNGTLSREFVTDETGTLEFSLDQSSWFVHVKDAPSGYIFDKTVKYEFSANGICNIKLERPIGYTFVAKSAYGENPVVPGVLVSLYPWDDELGWYDTDPSKIVTSGVTDANGAVTLEAIKGKYLAQFYVGENQIASEISIDAPTDVYEVEVYDKEGASADSPIYIFDTEIYSDINLGTEIWYSIERAYGKTLTIEAEDVYVIYNGETFPAEEGRIEIDFDDVAFDANALIAIGYNSSAEDAEEVKTVIATVIAPLGSMDNPHVLSTVDELKAALNTTHTLEDSENDNGIYYKWTPDFSGRLFILCNDESNYITIGCGNYSSDMIEGAPVIYCDFQAWVDTYICVAAMKDWAYVAAEFDTAVAVYGKYTAEVTHGIAGAGCAGQTVTVTDAEGNAAATITTDLNGKAETFLPLDAYTVSTTVPAGYTVEPVELTAGVCGAKFYVANSFEDLPTSRGNSMVVIPAGATQYYSFNTVYDAQFNLGNAAGVSFIYEDGTVAADEFGSLNVIVPEYLINWDTGKVYFALTNTTDAEVTVMGRARINVPGMLWDLAIDTMAGDSYTASVNEDMIEGCVYYKFVATEKGLIKVTTASPVAGITINNITQGKYYNLVEADADTSVDNPTVARGYAFAEGDEIQIIIGTNDWSFADVDFSVEFATEYATYTATLKDAANNPSVGSTVKFINLNNEVVATATTNVDGNVSVELPVEEYTVIAEVADYLVSSFTVNADEKDASLVAAYDFAALPAQRGNYAISLPQGATYNYMIKAAYDVQLSIFNAAGLTLTCGDITVSADEYGNIEALLPAAAIDSYTGYICFSLTNAAEADADALGRFRVNVPGMLYELAINVNSGESYTASVNEDMIEGAVYYKFVATSKGLIKITTASAVAGITINNITQGKYYSIVEADADTSVDNPTVARGYAFAEGDEIQIMIGTNNWSMAEIEFSVEFVSEYATYTAVVNDAAYEASEGQTVTFTNLNGEVMATATTDAEGKVSVELPLDSYTVTATVPAGYTSASYTVSPDEKDATINASPYALGEPQEYQMPGGTFTGYKFDLAADELRYYMARLDGTYTLKIENAYGLKVVYNTVEYYPNRIGLIEVELTGGGFFAPPTEFTLVNTDTDNAVSAMATLEAPIVGDEFDNPTDLQTADTYVADYVAADYPNGGVFYRYYAEGDGTLRLSVTGEASIDLSNLTKSTSVGITDLDSAGYIEIAVSDWDEIIIFVGEYYYTAAPSAQPQIEFTIEVIPAA